MESTSRVFVAGHRGLVGSAIVRRLQAQGAQHLILRTRQELELTDQAAVETFFATEKPEVVFLAAAKVGGILVNSTQPAEFLYENWPSRPMSSIPRGSMGCANYASLDRRAFIRNWPHSH